MDTLKRFTILNDSAVVTVMNTTKMVEKARKLHDLSPVAAAALGRVLTVVSFMSSRFKAEDALMSVTIDGGGPLGKIVAAGNYGGNVRGYVENPHVDLPLKPVKKLQAGVDFPISAANFDAENADTDANTDVNANGGGLNGAASKQKKGGKVKEIGKLDVGAAVGKNGSIRCVTDLKMKEPYLGTCDLVSGEIGEDFAEYFLKSEQQPSVVAVGVLLGKTGVMSAGGVFIQPYPGVSEDILVMLEDIATNFTNVSMMLKDIGVEGIIENYFSHLGVNMLTEIVPRYKCSCNLKKIENAVRTLGDLDVEELLKEHGEISVECHFCNKKYVFDKEQVEKIRSKKTASKK